MYSTCGKRTILFNKSNILFYFLNSIVNKKLAQMEDLLFLIITMLM